MCCGVYYYHNGQNVRVWFSERNAVIGVKTKHSGVLLMPWGRRKGQAGKLPLGGWARLDAVYAGRWDQWFPVPVKLPVISFVEQDIEGRHHWYELTRGQWLQGLIARHQYERRLYVVTVEPELEDAIHSRWPRILCG